MRKCHSDGQPKFQTDDPILFKEVITLALPRREAGIQGLRLSLPDRSPVFEIGDSALQLWISIMGGIQLVLDFLYMVEMRHRFRQLVS
jgi:hypothetical protein